MTPAARACRDGLHRLRPTVAAALRGPAFCGQNQKIVRSDVLEGHVALSKPGMPDPDFDIAPCLVPEVPQADTALMRKTRHRHAFKPT